MSSTLPVNPETHTFGASVCRALAVVGHAEEEDHEFPTGFELATF